MMYEPIDIEEDEVTALIKERMSPEMAHFGKAKREEVSKQKYKIRPSAFAEQFFTIPGDRRPFSFKRREYLKFLYDIPDQKILLMAGRQVEKSSTMAVKSAILGAIYPGFKTLYVAPRFGQTTVFSRQRFQPLCEDSRVFSKVWLGTQTIWQIRAREFLNRSFFNFASCYLTPDAVRGISAHNLMIDEIQDIVPDFVPILEACQSHTIEETEDGGFDLLYRLYAGTPKTTINTLAQYWDESSQCEWMVKCPHCSKEVYLDDRVLQKDMYACYHCGKEIKPRIHGRWVMMQPSKKEKFMGFRLPQIIVPHQSPRGLWDIFHDPLVTRRTFFNECLGLPYDVGEIPITIAHMRPICDPFKKFTSFKELKEFTGPKFAGIDHGSGETESSSFTVVAICTWRGDGKLHFDYIERFTGAKANRAKQPEFINKLCREAGVTWAGSDWGFGNVTNLRLWEEYGWKKFSTDGENPLLLEFMETSLKERIKYKKSVNRYHLNRNFNMSLFIEKIYKDELRFPSMKEMEPFIKDFTSIRVEENDRTEQMSYGRARADDTFHACKYAWLAGEQFHGRLTPTYRISHKDYQDYTNYNDMWGG